VHLTPLLAKLPSVVPSMYCCCSDRLSGNDEGGMFWPPFFVGFLRVFFCLSALICILAFSPHVWHTWIISCSSCACVDIRHKSSTYRIPPIHTLLPLCVMVACGNLRWSSCIKSATTMPNMVGLSLLPSGSPWRISTSELWLILGCRTRILTILKSEPEGMPHFSNDVPFVHRR